MHFVNCEFSQQAKIRFVAESATLPFFYLLCCFGFHGQIYKTLYCSKLLQKLTEFRMCGIRNQFVESVNKFSCKYMCFVNFSCRGIHNCKWKPQILTGFRKSKRNPQIVCGIRIYLRNPLAFAESTYICGIRDNYSYSLVAKSAAKSICRRNLLCSYL